MILNSTILERSPNARVQTETVPFLYGSQVKNLQLDGKLEDVFMERVAGVSNQRQTDAFLTDANGLKALFTTGAPAVNAAKAALEEDFSTTVRLDLGKGERNYDFEKTEKGDFRLIDEEWMDHSVKPQVVILQGGEHGHYVELSSEAPPSEDELQILQNIKMSYTKSGNFFPARESIHVGTYLGRELLESHIRQF